MFCCRNYAKSKKRNDTASTSGNGQNKDQSKSRESHSSTKMKPSRQRNINGTVLFLVFGERDVRAFAHGVTGRQIDP